MTTFQNSLTETKPGKPWKLSKTQLTTNFAIFFGSLFISPVIVLFSPFSGRLGFTFVFIVTATLATTAVSVSRFGTKAISNSIASAVIYIATGLVLIPLISILYTVISKGVTALRINTFTQDMAQTQPDAAFNDGGALHAIIGTGLLVLIAAAICVPIGILTALYLTEVKGRFSRLVRFLVQAMSGVPSIVAGLFVYSVLIVGLGSHYSGFAGALALSILMLPTVARTSEEVLKLIPNDLREAGVALGGTQWRTVARIVLPTARSGLMTAVILGVARVAGETAPLLLTILGSTAVHINPFDAPMNALPLYTFNLMRTGIDIAVSRAWTGSLVLLMLVLTLFIFARLLSGKRK
jgi:phosphate transport system permease protein